MHDVARRDRVVVGVIVCVETCTLPHFRRRANPASFMLAISPTPITGQPQVDSTLDMTYYQKCCPCKYNVRQKYG